MTNAIKAAPPLYLGFDVGGTSIKSALIDVATGSLHGPLNQEDTPQPATPQAIASVIRGSVAQSGPGRSVHQTVGVALPAVIQDGTTRTAANIAPSWHDFQADKFLAVHTERPTALINDADAAGLAEMRFGEGRNQQGVTLMITLGTGIGSSIFIDGTLLPNTELGHLHINEMIAEQWASAVARERHELPWSEYAHRLQTYLSHLERIFSPRLIIIGGGISAVSHKYLPELRLKSRVVPAKMGNASGVIGAAMAASEHHSALMG